VVAVKKSSTNLIKSLPQSASSFNWEPIKLGAETVAHHMPERRRSVSDFKEIWPTFSTVADKEPLSQIEFPSVPSAVSATHETDFNEITSEKNKEIKRLLGIKQSNQGDETHNVSFRGFDELKVEPDEPQAPKINMADLEKILNQINKDRQAIKELLDESVRSERKILDEARRQAEAILEEAKIRSETIMQETKQSVQDLTDQKEQLENQIDQIRSTAFEEGLNEGKIEAAQIIQSTNTIFSEAENWWKNMIAQSEPQIIQTIQAIAQKMFGSGVTLDTHSLKEVVGRAIEEASRLGNVRVYLNPEDAEKLIALWQESEIMYNGQKIELIPNQTILPGGCYLEGEYGSVDSRVETQLKLIQDSMNRTLSNNQRENGNG
jgi:flagellar assembly protein FliH